MLVLWYRRGRRNHPSLWWHHPGRKARWWRWGKRARREHGHVPLRLRRRHPHRHPNRPTHHRHHRLLRCEPRRWRRLRQRACKLTLIRTLEARHGRPRTKCQRCRGWPRIDRQRVVLPGLGSEETFRRCTVSFALSVLFKRVLHRDGLVHQELTVHRFDGGIRGFKVGVRNEAVAF